jgi:hypothetical protein
MIFGSINIMGIVGLAWCPLSKIQRIESFVVTNTSINSWFEIILRNYWHTLCYRLENNDKLCRLSIVAWKWIVIAQVEGFSHLRWIKKALQLSHQIEMNSFEKSSILEHLSSFGFLHNVSWISTIIPLLY